MFEKYSEYKDSGVEWIGEVPESWTIASIKHLLQIPITDGPHTTPQLLEDGIPFVSAEAIKNGEIDFKKKRGNISLKDHQLFSQKYLPKRGDMGAFQFYAACISGCVTQSQRSLSFRTLRFNIA